MIVSYYQVDSRFLGIKGVESKQHQKYIIVNARKLRFIV